MNSTLSRRLSDAQNVYFTVELNEICYKMRVINAIF
jgi:hypothetical protein